MLQMGRKSKALAGILLSLITLKGVTEMKPKEYFIYNHTPSIPTGIYFELPPDGIRRGDIVGFDPPKDMRELAERKGWIPTNATMMKEVGALEGDQYELTETGAFYAGGNYVGERAEHDSSGDRMPSIPNGKHVVPEDEVLLISKNPYAFDSRYFGTIPLKSIRFRAIRIFPFWD